MDALRMAGDARTHIFSYAEAVLQQRTMGKFGGVLEARSPMLEDSLRGHWSLAAYNCMAAKMMSWLPCLSYCSRS